MITKAQIIRMLEPFNDEIEIAIKTEGYLFNPYVYYQFHAGMDAARIVISQHRLNEKGTVELKV